MSPSDIAMVWTESETGALEKELPTDLKSIQILKEQVNRISLEKVRLVAVADPGGDPIQGATDSPLSV